MKAFKGNQLGFYGHVILEVHDVAKAHANFENIGEIIADSVPQDCTLSSAHMVSAFHESPKMKQRSFATKTCITVTINIPANTEIPATSIVRSFDRMLEDRLVCYDVIPVDSYSWAIQPSQTRS